MHKIDAKIIQESLPSENKTLKYVKWNIGGGGIQDVIRRYRHVSNKRILVTTPLGVSPKSLLIKVFFIPGLENGIWRKRTNTTPLLTGFNLFQLFLPFRRGLLLCTSERNEPGIVSVVPPHRVFWHKAERGEGGKSHLDI